MATHPKQSNTPRKIKKAKVAEAVQVDGVWRVRCYRHGLLAPEYGNWTKAATAAWRHGKH